MKYLKILFIFILNFNLNSISLELQSSFDEIKNKKELSFRIELEESENIIKNSLIFSFDDPSIDIKSSKISIEPENLFISSFKNNKKVYNYSFNLNLKLDFLEEVMDDNICFILQTIIFDEQKEINFAKTLTYELKG